MRQVKAVLFHRIVRRRQPPRENALANEPNPPRVTLPEPDSELPDEERLDVESPPKKLPRDHDPPAVPPPDENPRGWQAVLVGAPDAIAGAFGAQFSRGIIA
jgi:hypothetical protein